jgi:biopolymer transport protein ExbB/TolQ
VSIDWNTVGIVASVASLLLAVLFWHLAGRQAQNAESILREIRDNMERMASWQNDINSAAIGLIQARPEVIAQKVALKEAESHAAFEERLAGVIETLARESDKDSASFKESLVKALLESHRQHVLGSEQIKANVIAQQHRGEPPAGPKT